MPRVPASLLTRFGRGSGPPTGAARPGLAGGRLALGAAGFATFGGVAILANQVGQARNPPAQRIPVDANGDGVPESYVVFDPRTGGSQTYGQPPTAEGDPERSNERLIGWGIAGAAAVAVALIIARSG